ncbi:MAG: dicarboxylate/amino acid:cation symporter [Gammaproteobacteria bacterium]|nr:dicarboxylate/amino acid:cation symporter [Gammaproteobacteria bacterium]MCW8841277.1 dicarboxylate/amino acid:cation symporter [Gammaproteobacteria bacterium]MCW8927996.1 dicarboxylate/amino acid:cation symporter [Gammaproteobacteria bacterium]MCW8958199.1 dicarboxylate/amino acid:cation symporter [Gammaproteobacteria bacterium]MCW8972202.1 dicarboxylate/amino acid:cation symporter [Gammaproteobacteria bacterium]
MGITRLKLHWQILIALFLAVLAGVAAGEEGALFGLTFYSVFDFLGTLFLNALKMLIVPLIVSSIIVGIAGIGSSSALGRLGGKTLLYYLTTSLLAILVGLAVVNIITPGIDEQGPVKERVGFSGDTGDFADKVAGKGTGDVVDVFLRMVPTNIVAAAADGQMLGLIFFSLLFGFFMTKIQEDYAESQYNFWQGVYETMMRITDWVMLFAPIGVFALVAKVVASTGFDAFAPLAWFFISVVLALVIHVFVTLPLLLRFIGRVNPLRHYPAMAPALLTAFSTASSSATLPITMECVEKNAGVSNRTSSFVLPLGATVNMDGTALYECVAAMFIAQAYGLELNFATQFTIVTVALLTSIGVAGIPAASLVAIAIILAAIGLPLEGIGLILAVDRILDMLRTSTNVFSDSCGAVIIGRLQGEQGILQGKVAKG